MRLCVEVSLRDGEEVISTVIVSIPLGTKTVRLQDAVDASQRAAANAVEQLAPLISTTNSS